MKRCCGGHAVARRTTVPAGLVSRYTSLERVPIMLNRFSGVMAGLVPAIHVLLAKVPQEKTWMPATSAGMTAERCFDVIETRSSLFKRSSNEVAAGD